MLSAPNRTLQLGVMAKFWEPGAVKTRLGRSVGLEKAAQLHQLFCHFLADRLADAGDCRAFVIAPANARRDFQTMLPPAWAVGVQSGGGLGRRMQMWFAANCCGQPTGGSLDTEVIDTTAHDNAATDKVLIGADCPTITRQTIEQARAALATHDVVLGPAVDGGYYLIGLRGRWRREYQVMMADIRWSESSVLEQTLRQGRDAGLDIALLETMEDVDTVDELKRLRASLRDSTVSEERDLLESIDHVLSDGVIR